LDGSHLRSAHWRQDLNPVPDDSLALAGRSRGSPTRIGSLSRSVIQGRGRKVKMRSEVFWCRRHSGRPPQQLPHGQTRIAAGEITRPPGRMSASLVPRRITRPVGRMRLSIMLFYMSSAPFSCLRAIHHSSQHHEAQSSDSEAQTDVWHFVFPIATYFRGASVSGWRAVCRPNLFGLHQADYDRSPRSEAELAK
jgi:hypothetical protein